MKTIIATSLNYTPLGSLESVTLYYEDGSRKKIRMETLREQSRDTGFSLLRYYSQEFHLKQQKG